MKKWAVILTFCICNSNCIAQNNSEVLLHIPDVGKSISDFIPKGYDTMAVERYDFNNDGRKDIVLVLYDVREDTAKNGNIDIDGLNRHLIVLFKTIDGWRLVAQSNKLILCKGCGGVYGDPFDNIKISNGILNISHYGGSSWRWSENNKFRYQNGNFYLIGVTKNSYWTMADCDSIGTGAQNFEDINFITGKRIRKKTTEDCKILVNKTDIIKAKSLVKLSDYKFDN